MIPTKKHQAGPTQDKITLPNDGGLLVPCPMFTLSPIVIYTTNKCLWIPCGTTFIDLPTDGKLFNHDQVQKLPTNRQHCQLTNCFV